MIDLACSCGAHVQVLELYAGGVVHCHACGASVPVPAGEGAAEERFRFHCPHCEARVVAKKSSAGKKSECPVCSKIYVVPEPPQVEPPPSRDDRRIALPTEDFTLGWGLPFAFGKLERAVPDAPHARFLHGGDTAPSVPPVTTTRLEELFSPPHMKATVEASTYQFPPSSDEPSSSRRAAAPSEDFAAVEPRRDPAPDTPPVAPLSKSAPAPPLNRPRSGVGELEVIGGNYYRQRIQLDFRRFLVGAERDCDLRPPSNHISRHHCVFKRDEYALRVRDLGSSSGTFVNGRRISSEVILNSGDEVRVGDVKLHIVLPQSSQVTRLSAESDPSISDFVIL